MANITSAKVDERFRVLQNDRRRELLILLDNRGPMPLTAAARHLADSSMEYEDVKTSLYHYHVPTLVEADVLKPISSVEDTLVPTGEADRIMEMLLVAA